MSAQLFVLLPPSEAKSAGGAEYSQVGEFDEVLAVARRQVMGALSKLLDTASVSALEKTLGVRGPLLERALASTGAVVRGVGQVLPAWQRYTGVVWAHLDASTLSEPQRGRLLVPSGLYGLTSGNDLVADYRLKMSVSLAPLGRLASFWRPHLTLALTERVRGAVVVDLLPREHSAAIDEVELGGVCEMHRVTFVDHDGERAVGHDAKAVKGEVARMVTLNGLEGLAKFRWNGWKAHHHRGVVRIVAPRA